MGLLDRLFGAEWKALKELEANVVRALPPGWRYQALEGECMGSAPASHWVYAACAETADGVVAAVAQDRTEALHELLRLASGHAVPTTGWALPPMTFDGLPRAQFSRSPAPDQEARLAARAAAEACLPAGSVLSDLDREKVGPSRVRLFGVTAHLPDGTGLAAVATTGPAAYETLAGHVLGQVAATPTWTLRQSPTTG